MTDSVSPKLLVVLALSVAVACFGGYRMLSGEDSLADLGFDQGSELPIIVVEEAELSEVVVEVSETGGRNPFERADAEPLEAPEGDTSDEALPSDEAGPLPTDDASGFETSEPASGGRPIFPNPDLVGQDPTDPGADTSFEG